ncbi:tetratricopeptide repeat protein [Pontibacter lucknowensis]|uniref:Uncharacterized protein n=1 Tax=Pontibacter lucknowensis TaxID=1077936 RepID=A0A1N6TT02_9BACT|nr:hypothetical protein [Pontibacter lucknowensis]SIQ56357.1 hypothetical protein SAMN05421545_0488 [Pontibacter lucknowensis]
MKRALLLIWILTVAVAVQAQSRLAFNEAIPVSFLIKQEAAGNSSQVNSNKIIQLLTEGGTTTSKSGGRPSRKPEFVVRLEQQARIAKAGDQLQIKVQLQQIGVSGDVHYRGFDLGSVLLPEQTKMTVRLLNSQQKEVKRYSLPALNLKPNGIVALETTVPDTANSQGYTLKVEGLELVYTHADVQELEERISLIKDYYAADTTLNKMLQDVVLIKHDDVDRIKQQDQRLREMEEMLQKLQDKRFSDKLSLNQYDPQRYVAKSNQLNQLLKERRKAVNHTLATLDQQFYNRGISLMARNNLAAASTYFVKSLEVNPRFAPAHLQLARLDFMSGKVHEAAGRTRDILTQMRVDPETQQMALGLAHDIYSTFMAEGHAHNSRGDYRSAVAAYADARNLCSTLGGLRCNMPALNDGEGRAVYGYYRSMVEEGKRSLSRGDLAQAEQMADDAYTFQRQYDYLLHDATEAAELQGQVKYQYYVQHIDKGRQAMKAKDYRYALEQFESAMTLEQGYTFQPVRELSNLLQQAAKPVLLSQLADGYTLAMSNRLSDARAVASSAENMRSRYALERDTEVQAKYIELRDRIFTQECLNVQADYDRHYAAAQSLVKEKKFIAADQAYQAALNAAASKATCTIATFTAEDGQSTIADAAAYQRMLEEANRMVATGRYTDAIKRYNDAEQHYLSKSIARFGLDHISLYNFAQGQSKLAFTATVVDHFTGIRQEKAALQLLTDLLDRGYSKGKTKKTQQQLGIQLAIKDVTSGQTETAKVMAASYTQGDKKLKHLGKAYEKERKKLAKG